MKQILFFILNIYANLIFIYVLLSWFPRARYTKVGIFISNAVNPYLNVIRQMLPSTGQMDFSAVIGYIIIELAIYGVLAVF